MPSLIAEFSKNLDDLCINTSNVKCSKLLLLNDFSVLNLILCVTDDRAELFVYRYNFEGEEWLVDDLERYQMEDSDDPSHTILYLWSLLGIAPSCEHNLDITPVDTHSYSLISYVKLRKISFEQREVFQIEEAFVNENEQKAGVGMAAYSYLREQLGIIVSDKFQTVAAMQLWLNKIVKYGQVEAWNLKKNERLGQILHRNLDKSPSPIWSIAYSSYKPNAMAKRAMLVQQIEDLQDDYYKANICQEKDYTDVVLAFTEF